MAADQKSDTSLVAARGERASRIGAPSQSAQSPDLTSPSDHLNQQIVRMLEEDGRRPFNEIAAALNVSEGTIRNRVHGMRQAGQIRIVAIADPGAVKYKTDAIICIKVSPTATPAQVAERLGRLDRVGPGQCLGPNGAIKQPGIQMGKAEVVRHGAGDGAFASRRWPVDCDAETHVCVLIMVVSSASKPAAQGKSSGRS